MTMKKLVSTTLLGIMLANPSFALIGGDGGCTGPFPFGPKLARLHPVPEPTLYSFLEIGPAGFLPECEMLPNCKVTSTA